MFNIACKKGKFKGGMKEDRNVKVRHSTDARETNACSKCKKTFAGELV